MIQSRWSTARRSRAAAVAAAKNAQPLNRWSRRLDRLRPAWNWTSAAGAQTTVAAEWPQNSTRWAVVTSAWPRSVTRWAVAEWALRTE